MTSADTSEPQTSRPRSYEARSRTAAALAATTLVMFLWSGLTQSFPWGVPTVRNVAQTSDDPGTFGASPERYAPDSLVTTSFDEVLGDGIGTLTTDRSFAWVVSVRLERYDPARYFALEFATQLVCALMIVRAVQLLSQLPPGARVQVFALFGAGASVATYGAMTNWWGLPPLYGGGMSVNLVVGWALGAAVASFIVGRSRGWSNWMSSQPRSHPRDDHPRDDRDERTKAR